MMEVEAIVHNVYCDALGTGSRKKRQVTTGRLVELLHVIGWDEHSLIWVPQSDDCDLYISRWLTRYASRWVPSHGGFQCRAIQDPSKLVVFKVSAEKE
jgi:hypothetical protein